MSQTNSQNAPLSAALKAFDRAWAGQELTDMARANRAALSGETIVSRAANSSRDFDAEREAVDAAIDAAPMKTPGQRENLDAFVSVVTEIETARAALPAAAAPAEPKAKEPLKKATKPGKAAEKTKPTPTKAEPKPTAKGKPAKKTEAPVAPKPSPVAKKGKLTAAPKAETSGSKRPRSEEFYVATASDGKLNTDQVKILRVLRKLNATSMKTGVNRGDIKEGVGIGRDGLYSKAWLDSLKALNDQKLVEIYQVPEARGFLHSITAAGRKSLEAAEKAFSKANAK